MLPSWDLDLLNAELHRIRRREHSVDSRFITTGDAMTSSFTELCRSIEERFSLQFENLRRDLTQKIEQVRSPRSSLANEAGYPSLAETLVSSRGDLIDHVINSGRLVNVISDRIDYAINSVSLVNTISGSVIKAVKEDKFIGSIQSEHIRLQESMNDLIAMVGELQTCTAGLFSEMSPGKLKRDFPDEPRSDFPEVSGAAGDKASMSSHDLEDKTCDLEDRCRALVNWAHSPEGIVGRGLLQMQAQVAPSVREQPWNAEVNVLRSRLEDLFSEVEQQSLQAINGADLIGDAVGSLPTVQEEIGLESPNKESPNKEPETFHP